VVRGRSDHVVYEKSLEVVDRVRWVVLVVLCSGEDHTGWPPECVVYRVMGVS
jgi:hypothetical protein